MQQMDAETAQDGFGGTLYDRFALPIFAYLCQQVSNEQDAEDLLLEVFLAALSNETLSSLPAERQLAWLRRVARNKVIDRYRHFALLTLVPIEGYDDALHKLVLEVRVHCPWCSTQLAVTKHPLLSLPTDIHATNRWCPHCETTVRPQIQISAAS